MQFGQSALTVGSGISVSVWHAGVLQWSSVCIL